MIYLDPCPLGYEFRTGVIDNLLSNLKSNISMNRNECANLCKGDKECLSFIHSQSRNLCVLSEAQEPTYRPLEDFVFCKKIGLI